MSVKQAKIDYIISVASDLFLTKGIENVTLKDIAKEVGVGEATIYRHFATKQNLVMLAAQAMAGKIHNEYFDLDDSVDGITMIKAFYDNFLKIYEEHPEYYRFIFDFDTMVMEDSSLEQYEYSLLPYMEIYLDAYNIGLRDKTVNKMDNIELFYITTTHALMGLCKKLTKDSVILKQDSFGKEEIEILIDTIIYRLKKTK